LCSIGWRKTLAKSGISYGEAVEEALYFGRIDSKMKRIDDEKFMLRCPPRKKNSIWSEINKKRAEKMIKEGFTKIKGQNVQVKTII